MAIDATAGGASSTSYATVAQSDAYFLARSNSAWAALSNAAKESALVVATAYLDATYGGSWQGYRASTTQALDWPRSGVYVDNVNQLYTAIPARIVSATIELALKASAGALLADEGRLVKRTRIKVDVIEEETEYADYSPTGNLYGYVYRLLAPLISGVMGNATFQSARMLRV